MRNISSFSKIMLIAGLGILSLTACKDDDPVLPEKPDKPDVTVPVDPNAKSISITTLKAKYTGSLMQITESLYIEGVVTANDKSGNFFKEIVVQDGEAGIKVKLNKKKLSETYPVGTKVRVSIKDLYLGDYAKEIQLGATYKEGIGQIAEDQIEKHITKLAEGQTVEAKTVAIDAIDASLVSRLIKLEGVQFSASENGKTWSEKDAKNFPDNRTLIDANGNKIIVRTSDFSSFQSQALPTGSGSITAILSVFNGTYQLVVRGAEDAVMTGDRFDGTVDFGSKISIADLRAKFVGEKLPITDALYIQAVVTMDPLDKNIHGQSVVLQDESAGIVIRVESADAVAGALEEGKEVKVAIKGASISEYKGLLQIGAITIASNVEAVETSTITITPQIVTIKELTANAEDYESKVIEIVDVQFTAAKFSGAQTLFNCDEEKIKVYTRSDAEFAKNSLPTGKGSFVGILNQNTEYNLLVRNEADLANMSDDANRCELTPVVTEPVDGVLFISEYIEGGASNKAIEIYNPTDQAVELAGHKLAIYINGANESKTVELTGTIAAKGVFLVTHANFAAGLLPNGITANLTDNTVANFNGDDVIALLKDDGILDIFGTVGNPHKEYYAKDKTFRRKASIKKPKNLFDIADWDEFGKDDASNLGTHTVN